MFAMTAQEWVDKFTEDMKSGWLKPDDVIGMEYWTYDDVRDIVYADDDYDFVNDDVARDVWGSAASKLLRFDNVDNDVVRDAISEVLGRKFDERNGGN